MILSYLIQTNCEESRLAVLGEKRLPRDIQAYHRACPEDCVVRDLAGESDWLPVFSFGVFDKFVPDLRYRVSMDRERRTVAPGNLASVEVIPEGTAFRFSVVLTPAAFPWRQQFEQAVRDVGNWLGVGHYKSLGFGRFEVIEIKSYSVASELGRIRDEIRHLPKKFGLMLSTPLVLENGGVPMPLEGKALGEAILGALRGRAAGVQSRFRLPERSNDDSAVVEECAFSFRPDYVSRDSFEQGTRKNALVALAEGRLDVSFAGVMDLLPHQLAVAQLFGVGPWADVGFGRLKPAFD
jgi:hypothetical protein